MMMIADISWTLWCESFPSIVQVLHHLICPAVIESGSIPFLKLKSRDTFHILWKVKCLVIYLMYLSILNTDFEIPPKMPKESIIYFNKVVTLWCLPWLNSNLLRSRIFSLLYGWLGLFKVTFKVYWQDSPIIDVHRKDFKKLLLHKITSFTCFSQRD